jgi:hypothetical protein
LELPDLFCHPDLLEYLIGWFESKEIFSEDEIEKILILKSSDPIDESMLAEIKGLVLKKK